ncbi:hypothetical protein [Paraburkholderia bannensis]|uniref:hypothetical protein n=1 Tax=Paraburkholderia bannensis TaxID=765414 RepID=UPI0012EC38D8|nr:hypothetical protein [Paraburkholderia bannensis]
MLVLVVPLTMRLLRRRPSVAADGGAKLSGKDPWDEFLDAVNRVHSGLFKLVAQLIGGADGSTDISPVSWPTARICSAGIGERQPLAMQVQLRLGFTRSLILVNFNGRLEAICW